MRNDQTHSARDNLTVAQLASSTSSLIWQWMPDLNQTTDQKIESSEITILKLVTGYRRIYRNRNTYIRRDIKIFKLGKRIEEYRKNYFEHISRMPTYWLHWSWLITALKEEGAEVDHQRDVKEK
jgi:hypothetical protein